MQGLFSLSVFLKFACPLNGALFKYQSSSIPQYQVPAQQPSEAWQPLPALCGGRVDPCHIGKQEVGTYIHSLLYTTHWASGSSSSCSFTVVNVVERLVTAWAGERSLLRWLNQSSITHTGTTASSSSYGQETAIALSGGSRFYICIP